jgi:hypothetical protein
MEGAQKDPISFWVLGVPLKQQSKPMPIMPSLALGADIRSLTIPIPLPIFHFRSPEMRIKSFTHILTRSQIAGVIECQSLSEQWMFLTDASVRN